MFVNLVILIGLIASGTTLIIFATWLLYKFIKYIDDRWYFNG